MDMPRAIVHNRSRVWVSGLLALALSAACSTAPPVEEIPSAETYYNRGLEVLEGQRTLLIFSDVDYPKAIELFQEVIDNYPYSEYATLAELKIADVHFEQGKYEEAASYYQDFVELHPNNPRVDYAIFRNGLCAFQRLRAPDRDQTPTHEALDQFRALLQRYPDSEYADEAREMVGRGEDLLAEHDSHVGDFYMQRRRCHAAEQRYRSALIIYPHHTERLDTMYRLGRALVCMQREHEAIGLYQQILKEDPSEDLQKKVARQLRDLGVETRGPASESASRWWRPF
jgi:outer membrane protein assembly factor BamD